MTKVCIALIHNHNTERNATIQLHLTALQNCLSGSASAPLLKVAYQPEIKPHHASMALLRDVVYQVLDRDWLRYRHLPSFLPRHIASFLRTGEGRGWRCRSAIEMAVTDQYIRAR